MKERRSSDCEKVRSSVAIQKILQNLEYIGSALVAFQRSSFQYNHIFDLSIKEIILLYFRISWSLLHFCR